MCEILLFVTCLPFQLKGPSEAVFQLVHKNIARAPRHMDHIIAGQPKSELPGTSLRTLNQVNFPVLSGLSHCLNRPLRITLPGLAASDSGLE